MKDFTIDSVAMVPQQKTFASGVDYMADYDEWLFIQVSENVRMSTSTVTERHFR